MAAKEFLTHCPALPNLIVSDIKMPRLSGLELLEWVRANQPTKATPFILFTSSSETHDRDAAARLGATGYEVKPASPNQFARVLERWVGAVPG